MEGDFPVEFGRYTLLGILGEGAMARVYRAELHGPGGFTKPAAIKIVRGAVAGRGHELQESLLNEARLGGLLDHPNVVQTLDCGVVDGLPFIAMGHVRGVGLDRLLAEDVEVPAEVALDVALQIARGLDHAHNLDGVSGGGDLVHRDLKPSNVILDRNGLARVLDFGIAKAAALSVDTTAIGATKGTPAYMSPEQANGETLDRRSDIFSLGILLHELITGRRLFASTSPLATLQAVLHTEDRIGDPAFEEQLNNVVPGLGPVVSRCLRFNPEDRYKDCAEFERALREVASTFTPAPLLRDWVRDLQDTLGLGDHDPVGLSIDTPALGLEGGSFGPDGRPRALGPAPDNHLGEDDIQTDGAIPAVDDAPRPPREVSETRQMPSVTAEDIASIRPPAPAPARRKLLLAALVALATAAAAVVWVASDAEESPVVASTPLDATAPTDTGGLSEPLPVVERPETPEIQSEPLRPRSRRTTPTGKRSRRGRGKSAAVTPTDPLPAPPPLDVNLQQGEREGGKVKIVVTARLDATQDVTIHVHFKTPLGPWRKAPLKSMGSNRWFRMVEVAMPPGAALRWYATAEFQWNDRKARIREGTKTDAKKFILPLN